MIPLLQRPELIPSVARWIYGEWSYEFTGVTSDAWMIGFAAALQPHGVPTTLIALNGEELVGTASLDPSDLPSRPALRPWLGSLYVSPPWRGRGVASLLVREVEAEARRRDVGKSQLNKFTPEPHLLTLSPCTRPDPLVLQAARSALFWRLEQFQSTIRLLPDPLFAGARSVDFWSPELWLATRSA